LFWIIFCGLENNSNPLPCLLLVAKDADPNYYAQSSAQFQAINAGFDSF
jgi:hypothetical protein